MIRNNQNGRRRGRGGARPPQAGGGPSGNYNNGGGSRVDVRQRGNATQLLEKYKAMARDATQNGDRVQAEFYMQYADHYYRVLNEFRARDPQPAPRQNYDDGDDDGQNYGNGNGQYAPQNYAPPQADGRYADEADDDGDDYEAPPPRQAAPQPERQNERPNDRPRGNYDQQQRGPRNQNGQRDPQRDPAPRSAANDPRPRDDGRANNGNGAGEARGDRYSGPRGGDPIRRDVAPPPTDDVALIPGLPGPATVAAPIEPEPVAAPDFAEASADAAPAPRRRGRPRKVVVEDAADA